VTRYNLPSGSYPATSDAGYLEGCILRVTALHVTR